MTYPIAEIFHSIQGEGFWTGTPMMFIRLAGCNVGKYDTGINADQSMDVSVKLPDFILLQEKKHSICTTYDGQRFLCDTDYHTHQKLTEDQLFELLQEEGHVCITGGEPFLHDLQPLVSRFSSTVLIHVETSGTLDPTIDPDEVWLTCCPKEGFDGAWFSWADEFKILVGQDFDEEEFEKFDLEVSCRHCYLQPINGVHDLWKENLNRCLDLLKRYPHWKLSAQLHKYLGVA